MSTKARPPKNAKPSSAASDRKAPKPAMSAGGTGGPRRLPAIIAALVVVGLGAALVWSQLGRSGGSAAGGGTPTGLAGAEGSGTPHETLGAGVPISSSAPSSPGGPRAVIVDQLSLTFANPGFLERTTALLKQAGYGVDYVPGEQVSVRFYQDLPAKGYDLVLLRVHSARREVAGTRTDDVALFTGELIDLVKYNISGVPAPAATAVAKAKADLAAGRMTEPKGAMGTDLGPAELKAISPVYYDPGSGELPYFGLLPAFIEQHLSGQFKADTTVVLMGCDGLRSDALAKAFVARGAARFVSWDKPVTASHTDEATEALLKGLVAGRPLADATREAMAAVGPDPTYGSVLQIFPRQ